MDNKQSTEKELIAITTWGQIRSYIVLCLTETHTDKPENRSKRSYYHQPANENEIAEVIPSETAISRVKFDTTVIHFRGYTWKLLYIRPGLSGTAVTLGIERPLDDYNDVWELYTDTPWSEETSVEEVRKQAKWAIAHRRPSC
ncbi:MAG: hypothetical protein WC536_02165 [Patescibacteria group bacterium]